MSGAPYDVQIPATESQIAEAIRLSCPEEADTIRRLAFERDSLRERLGRLVAHYERMSQHFMPGDIRGPMMADAAKDMREMLEKYRPQSPERR
jgi:hypothetical protein